MISIKSLCTKFPVCTFCIVLSLLTFLVIPLLTSAVWSLNPNLMPSILQNALFTYTPAFSALIVISLSVNNMGVNQLIKSLNPSKNYLPAYFAIPIISIGIMTFSILMVSSSTFEQIGVLQLDFWQSFLSILLLQFFIVGVGEELGWRGFLFPQAKQKFSVLTTTLIIFLIWSAWHTPKLFSLSSTTQICALYLGLFAFSFGCLGFFRFKKETFLE